MIKYKESGVEWIGQIPETWNLIRLKDKYRNIKEIVGDRVLEFERLALTLGGVIKRDKEDDKGLQPKDFDNYQILRAGDFVFKMIDLQNVSTSRVGLSPYDGIVSPAYLRFSPKNNKANKFLYYYLMSMYFNCVFNSLGGDGVRSSLSAEDMGNIICPFPSKEEQQRIADFLDKKCSQIEKLIKLQEKEIKKLKDYKDSFIVEIIKGSNKNNLTESSIKWIGKQPSDWKVVLLSSLVKERKNKNIGMTEKNLLSLSYGNVVRRNIDATEGLLPESFEGYNIIEKGDIVLRLTDLQNDHTSLRTGLCKEKGIITSAYITLQLKTSIVSPEYLRYYLHSFDICKGFYGMGAGIRQGLNYDGVKKLQVLLPTIEEQEKIISLLDNKCQIIDDLVKVKKEKIDKLVDYKKSLIYECVTGKKEI